MLPMTKMYMIAKHTQVLRNPKNHKEGFMTNESFNVSHKLKNSDHSEASIIIECSEQKIIKNRFPDRNFEELYGYFATHYSDHINRWINAQKI